MLLFPAIALLALPQHSTAQTLLYGTSLQGGDALHNAGTIFSFNPATDSVQTLYIFKNDTTDGSGPEADLIYDQTAGLFHTTTFSGGKYTAGSFISFNPTTGRDSLLWSFGAYASDGISAFGTPVYDATSGMFYMLTAGGGTGNFGALCGFNPATGRDTVLHSFSGGTDGNTPMGSLCYDGTNSSWYGFAAVSSGGAMFQYTPATGTYNHLTPLSGSLYTPTGTPYYDAASGLFYCMGSYGGTHNQGSIFTFNPATLAVNVLWSFGATGDGQRPVARLVKHPTNGLFYGMTDIGGSHGSGTIFSFNPATGLESVVWNFNASTEGYYPMGTLTYYPPDGKFYGMCSAGGTHSGGTLFSFDPVSDAEVVLWNFGVNHTSAVPYGSLSLKKDVTDVKHSPANTPFSIYPNPSIGTSTVTGLPLGTVITIYDLRGQKLLTTTMTGATLQINLGSFTNGLYMMQAANADGTAGAYKKLVLMR